MSFSAKDTITVIGSDISYPIFRHIYPGYLSYYKYHGPRREDDTNKLFNSDMVLTTYATVAMELSNGRNTLRNVEWFRIILDEGKHFVHQGSSRVLSDSANLPFQPTKFGIELPSSFKWLST